MRCSSKCQIALKHVRDSTDFGIKLLQSKVGCHEADGPVMDIVRGVCFVHKQSFQGEAY